MLHLIIKVLLMLHSFNSPSMLEYEWTWMDFYKPYFLTLEDLGGFRIIQLAIFYLVHPVHVE